MCTNQVRRNVIIQKTVFIRNLKNYIPQYHMKTLLGDFNAKLGREDIFRLAIGNESLHQDGYDNGVRIVKFATSKNLVVKTTMFLHQNVHTYTLTTPDWETHNHIDHILIEGRPHSSILDIRFFVGADNDTDHCLVVAKVRERLAVSKEEAQFFDVERFNHRKLS